MSAKITKEEMEEMMEIFNGVGEFGFVYSGKIYFY